MKQWFLSRERQVEKAVGKHAGLQPAEGPTEEAEAEGPAAGALLPSAVLTGGETHDFAVEGPHAKVVLLFGSYFYISLL